MLRLLLEPGRPVVHAAGVWDGLTALLAAEAGYPALFLSGAALATTRAERDAEPWSPEELCRVVARITGAVEVPVIVDVDTGFGPDLAEVVVTLRRLGAGAVMLEDQRAPKSGAVEAGAEPPLEDADRFAERVALAVSAAGGGMLVVARSNARGPDLTRRLVGYADAGADVVFPLVLDDGLPLDGWADLARRAGRPVACTLAPGTWAERTMDDATAASVGVRLIVHALHGLLSVATAYRATMTALAAGTPPAAVSTNAMSYADLRSIIGRGSRQSSS